tara:strand:- start:8620 stop:10245 length:1626 start_codon:yes stop_codon:yes gene_type:complete
MPKTIIITEEQYKRIFLNEQDIQTKGDEGSSSGNYSGGNSNINPSSTIPSDRKKKEIDPTDLDTSVQPTKQDRYGGVNQMFQKQIENWEEVHINPKTGKPYTKQEWDKKDKSIYQFNQKELVVKYCKSIHTKWCNGSSNLKVVEEVEEDKLNSFINGDNSTDTYYRCSCKSGDPVNFSDPDNTSFKVEYNKFYKRWPSPKDTLAGVALETAEGVWEWVKDCGSDYHCIADAASIFALIIPPPWGVLVSAGIDAANSLSYGVEAIMTDDPLERKGLLMAGSLTLLGIIPGIGEARLVMATKSPKVLTATDNFLEKVHDLGKNPSKTGINRVFIESTKDLSEKEVKSAQNYLNTIIQNKEYAKSYANSLTQLGKKYDQNLLQKVGSNENFMKLVKEEKGDVVKALNRFKLTEAGKDFLTQLGLFVGVGEALPPTIKYARSSGLLGIKSQVESDGFNWESVKRTFQSSGTTEDNIKLEGAWNAKWRPGDPVPPKFRTVSYNKSVASGAVGRDQDGKSVYSGGKEDYYKRVQDAIKNNEQWDGTY